MSITFPKFRFKVAQFRHKTFMEIIFFTKPRQRPKLATSASAKMGNLAIGLGQHGQPKSRHRPNGDVGRTIVGTSIASMTAELNFRVETRHFLTFLTSMAQQTSLKINFSSDLVIFEMKFLCFVQIYPFYSNFFQSWTKPGNPGISRDSPLNPGTNPVPKIGRDPGKTGSRELIPKHHTTLPHYLR